MTTTRRLRTNALTLAAGVGTCVVLGAGRCEAPEAEPGEVTFEDDFEGAAGTSPDGARWVFDIGGGGFGNDQLEHNTDRPQNASLDGEGNLVITARRETFGGNNFTSARLTTAGTFAQAYGRFEARIKVPAGQGIWPAFWLLGDNIEQVTWPACGEIDVLELRGQEPNVVYGSVHGPGYSGGGAINTAYTLPPGQSFADGFHVFAVEWEQDRIRYFVDDNLYQTITPATLGGRAWVFDHPFRILVNLAVGGNFVGPPDATTVFPAELVVDYVRVTAGSP
jgi:beta-glucanase (GH16 family)